MSNILEKLDLRDLFGYGVANETTSGYEYLAPNYFYTDFSGLPNLLFSDEMKNADVKIGIGEKVNLTFRDTHSSPNTMKEFLGSFSDDKFYDRFVFNIKSVDIPARELKIHESSGPPVVGSETNIKSIAMDLYVGSDVFQKHVFEIWNSKIASNFTGVINYKDFYKLNYVDIYALDRRFNPLYCITLYDVFPNMSPGMKMDKESLDTVQTISVNFNFSNYSVIILPYMDSSNINQRQETSQSGQLSEEERKKRQRQNRHEAFVSKIKQTARANVVSAAGSLVPPEVNGLAQGVAGAAFDRDPEAILGELENTVRRGDVFKFVKSRLLSTVGTDAYVAVNSSGNTNNLGRLEGILRGAGFRVGNRILSGTGDL